MKKLLFIAFVAIALGAKAQADGDTIVRVWPDTLLVGDTLHVQVFYQVYPANGWGNDSVYMDNASPAYYLHDHADIATHLHDSATLISKIVIPYQNGYTDSTYTKLTIDLYHTYNQTEWINNPRRYIYIKDTVTHPLGINTIIGINHSAIKEVRYYTITGQLYGTYQERQNNLPHVPLIEEVIYTNNEFSSRELLHL